MGRRKKLFRILVSVSLLTCVYWSYQRLTGPLVLLAKVSRGPQSTNFQPVTVLRISKIDHALHIDQPYFMILPDEISASSINLSELGGAINLMEKYINLNAISGLNVANTSVYCSGFISDWSLYLSRDRGRNIDPSQQSDLDGSANNYLCQECLLLPYGPILFRYNGFLSAWKYLNEKAPGGYQNYGIGLLYSLIISLNQTGAYCPNLRLVTPAAHPETSSGMNYFSESNVCSKALGFPFDQKFPVLADLLSIYRIVLPEGTEAWLNCDWDHRLLNSSASCANWHFRYLQDIVRLFNDSLNWDYRLLFGTALGAIRDGDIIPWTADLDIIAVHFETGKPVEMNPYRYVIRQASGYRYDYVAIDRKDHARPYRMVPRCPVVLNLSARTSSEEMALIGELFASKNITMNIASEWRNLPYVDIYDPKYITQHFAFSYNDTINVPFDLAGVYWAKIRSGDFKLIGNTLKYLRIWYGSNWHVPSRLKGSFIGRF